MDAWEQPHWSGRPQPKPESRPRLRPNPFALLTRAAARQAIAVAGLALALAFAGTIAAVFRLHIDPGRLPLISLDQATLDNQQRLDRSFPAIESVLVAQVEAGDRTSARKTAEALAAALLKRSDLFAGAFVPGTGPYYDKYAYLFRDTTDLDVRVDHALQSEALYRALAAAPDIGGLSALIEEIDRSVARGQSPPAMTDFLQAANRSFEGELAGKPHPVDWVALAGLAPASGGTRWFVLATPQPGHAGEASAYARAVTRQLKATKWFMPPEASARAPEPFREFVVPALVAGLASSIVLLIGLGKARYVVPVVLSAAMTAAVTAGIAGFIVPVLDRASWTIWAAPLASSFLFGILIATSYAAQRLRGKLPVSAAVLASQRRGIQVLFLASIAEIFWLSWIFRDLPSLAGLAEIAAISVAMAVLASLTLVPALLVLLDRREDVEPHWFDLAVAEGLGPNGKHAVNLLALVVIAAAAFCSVFVPGLRFGDQGGPLRPRAPLASPVAIGAVHIVSEPGEQARQLIARIARLPETGSIRWVEQFLPAETDHKVQSLKRLEGLLVGGPTPRTEAALVDPQQIYTSMRVNLQEIAENSAAEPLLRDAAQQLGHSIDVFFDGDKPPPPRIQSLESSLFQGLAELSAVADRLARLRAPGLAELDPNLKSRFVGADGSWRIEVLPKPGVTSLSFAAALRRAWPAAAGAPLAALAGNEVMHHETGLALFIAILVAAAAMLAILRNVWDAAIALIPTAAAVTLSAAFTVGWGALITSGGLAAATTALPMSLSTAALMIDRRELDRSAPDTLLRAALLPLLALMASLAPLALSTDYYVAQYGRTITLYLTVSLATNLVLQPQIADWVRLLRRPRGAARRE
jgi:hypothetical protein